jgi:hypothetical protein
VTDPAAIQSPRVDAYLRRNGWPETCAHPLDYIWRDGAYVAECSACGLNRTVDYTRIVSMVYSGEAPESNA